jgi:hypothetical protein
MSAIPDVRWRVVLAGRDRPSYVNAAYLSWDARMITLKDSDNTTVFIAPADHVQYVYRDPEPDTSALYITAPGFMTASQIRELQAALEEAATEFNGKVIVLPPGSKKP